MPMIQFQTGDVNRDDENYFSWLGCTDCMYAKQNGKGITCNHEQGPKLFVFKCLRQRPRLFILKKNLDIS